MKKLNSKTGKQEMRMKLIENDESECILSKAFAQDNKGIIRNKKHII